MRALLILIGIAFTNQQGFCEESTAKYEQNIAKQAALIDLHKSVFIHATGVLAKAQTIGRDNPQKYELAYPLENHFIASWAKGELIPAELVPTDMDANNRSPSGEQKSIRKQPVRYLENHQDQSIREINSALMKHANALQLPALYLPRFYQLQSHTDFAWLFDTSEQAPKSARPMSDLTVELMCQYTIEDTYWNKEINLKNDCAREYRRSQSDQVALLWQHAHAAGIQDNQGFVVRYVNTQGEQVGTQEIWTYFEKMGPRFLQTLN